MMYIYTIVQKNIIILFCKSEHLPNLVIVFLPMKYLLNIWIFMYLIRYKSLEQFQLSIKWTWFTLGVLRVSSYTCMSNFVTLQIAWHRGLSETLFLQIFLKLTYYSLPETLRGLSFFFLFYHTLPQTFKKKTHKEQITLSQKCEYSGFITKILLTSLDTITSHILILF